MDKNYNENRDKNPDQIIKKFGKDVFIEVIQPNDQFERVIVNLVSLSGVKQKEKISCYVDMDEWLTLCNRIATGRFGKYVEDAKRACVSNNGFPPELWKRQGGKATPGGAWMLSIHPATKGSNAVMIKAQRGAGEAMSNGLIKFIYNRNNPQVMIGLTHEMLEDIANMSLMRINAYIVSRQMRGCYDRKYIPSSQTNAQPEYGENVIQYPSGQTCQPEYGSSAGGYNNAGNNGYNNGSYNNGNNNGYNNSGSNYNNGNYQQVQQMPQGREDYSNHSSFGSYFDVV